MCENIRREKTTGIFLQVISRTVATRSAIMIKIKEMASKNVTKEIIAYKPTHWWCFQRVRDFEANLII